MRMRWRNRWRRGIWLGVIGVVLVNGLAWSHARRMTHYADTGEQLGKIEALSPAEKIQAVLLGLSPPRPANRHTPADLGLPHETVVLPMGDAEQIVAWSVPHPQARGVVALFPAYATSKESLLPPARLFHDLGYTALLVDFRGVGDSTGAQTTLGVREAEDVARATDYARQTWPDQPLILFGVSMGSAAILRAVAVEGVRADALILESPFDRLASTVGNRIRAFGLPATPGTELLVFWGSVQIGANGFAHNPTDYARAVSSPTLILHGERDPRVTLDQVTTLHAAFPDRATLVHIPGAEHESLATAAPENWRTAVAAFLSAIEYAVEAP